MTAQPIPRNVPPKVASARGKLVTLIRLKADPETIAAARAQLAEANAEAAIARLRWLPTETRARLACQLLGGGDGT